MAWVRTATSLISFGFTIYKFFQYLQEQNPEKAVNRLFGPREFALAMIATGVAAVVFGTIDHQRQLHAIDTRFGAGPRSLAAVLAGLVSVLGLLGFVAVLLRQ